MIQQQRESISFKRYNTAREEKVTQFTQADRTMHA